MSAHTRRRAAGRYDTPPSLARLVATLALAHAPDDGHGDVLDPTCGEGNLLLEAAVQMADALARHTHREPDEAAQRTALREVIATRLYGVERDAAVLARCRARLTARAGLPSHALDARLVHGDALSLTARDRWRTRFEGHDGRFAHVVANPPFLNAIERHAAVRAREGLRRRHPELGATADIAAHALALVDTLRTPDGRAAIVLPRALFAAPSTEALRARLTPSVRALYAFTSARIFPDAHVHVGVVALGPGEGCTLGLGRTADDVTLRTSTLPDGAWWGALHDDAVVHETGHMRLSDRFEVRASMTASEAYAIADALDDRAHGDGLALVTTGLLDRARCLWGERPCRYLGRTLLHPRLVSSEALPASVRRRMEHARRPKLLVAGLGRRIECALDPHGAWLGAVSTWTITHPHDDLAALHALMAWLHGDAVHTRLHTMLGATALGGGSVTVTRRFLDAIPLPDDGG